MARRFKAYRGAIDNMVEGEIGAAAAEVVGTKIEDAARRAAAGIRVDGEPGDTPLPIEGTRDVYGGPGYYVGIPHAAGAAVESKHRVLGSALTSGGS